MIRKYNFHCQIFLTMTKSQLLLEKLQSSWGQMKKVSAARTKSGKGTFDIKKRNCSYINSLKFLDNNMSVKGASEVSLSNNDSTIQDDISNLKSSSPPLILKKFSVKRISRKGRKRTASENNWSKEETKTLITQWED